ncbi:MaoC/PaaZ C-terminal domain-containing protein [Pilimelia columellifera]|uniref:MaoC family dehydratase n=1 Tax=Pilimelia columellifera subsp. columellifera TaxID=706583 RepID=A0ABN3NDZ7_9ACTN
MSELPTQTYRVTRADLVRYAGASGDFNPIHWSDRVAAEVGLPGVIAHGMLTMALAGRAVSVWAGRVDAITEFGVRFARPVVVPDDAVGAEISVAGMVKGIVDGGLTRIDLTVTCCGERVLAQARAFVRLPGDTGAGA